MAHLESRPPHDDDYKYVLEWAAQILQSAGYLFSVAMMPASPHPLRSRLPLLKKAASRSDLGPSPDLVQKIEAVCAGRCMTLRMLCAEFDLSPNLVPALLVIRYISRIVESSATASGGFCRAERTRCRPFLAEPAAASSGPQGKAIVRAHQQLISGCE